MSNLSFVQKQVEKTMLSQFTDHCNTHDLQPAYQSAYCTNYSTVKVTALMAMDLSAAFNTVDHEILLSTLENRFGISGDAKWFDEYLRPRSLKVCVNGTYYKEIDINYSVSQGSVVGTVIFNAYSSTMENIIPSSLNLNGYAEDHVVNKAFTPTVFDDKMATIHTMQQCMVDVKTWMDAVRLKLNSSKFIYFGSRVQLAKCAH